MPRRRKPRRGSMQFWPRKKAADIVPRIRNWAQVKDTKLQGFAGYKVGMTHVILTDNKPTSQTKGEEITVPVTILECPPIKIISIKTYTKDAYGLHCSGQINAEKLDPELERKLPKQVKHGQISTNYLAEVRVIAQTQPKMLPIGKKKPDLLELEIGGTKLEEKLAYAQSILGKEFKINDIFTEGQLVDTTSVTKGKGFQGPVRRFGVSIRSHKSQKAIRNPGSLGPWHGFKGGYRVPHAGQTGFHQRMEYNKHILKINDDPTKINVLGGFKRYGLISNQYILLKGSVGGVSKRIITLTSPRRPQLKLPKEAPAIVHISTSSKQ